MTTADDLALLASREKMARQALLWAAAVLLIAFAIRGLLVPPYVGIEAVHIPGEMGWDWTDGMGPLGDGLWAIPHAIALVLDFLSLVAAVALIWALCVRRAGVVTPCLAFFLIHSLISPLPVLHPAALPRGTDLSTAQRLLGPASRITAADNEGKRYIAAQIAFLQGNRAAARRLSQGIEADVLGSRDAAYRLPLLQGRKPDTTIVCFKYGCLSPQSLAEAQKVTMALAVLAALGMAIAAYIWHLLRTRNERIAELRSTMHVRKRSV